MGFLPLKTGKNAFCIFILCCFSLFSADKELPSHHLDFVHFCTLPSGRDALMHNFNSQDGVFKPILGIKITPEGIPIQNEGHKNVQSRDHKKRVSVIVNPISGGKDKTSLCEQIKNRLDKEYFDVEILYTQAPKHATLLTKDALNRHAEIIVAVGGDGLINEISQSLIGSGATLAIIPTGSGNGLARHLKIPMKISQAIELIEKGQETMIDSVHINDKYYVGVAGIGFDAEVSLAFSEFSFRGPLAYMLVTLQQLWGYKPTRYHISVDGKKISRKAFMICFANSSQFGNDAYIAPLASINDGYLDLILVKKAPLLTIPHLLYQLFHQSLNHSKQVEMFKCKEIVVHGKHLRANVDGEPVLFDENIHIQIRPSSLKVLVPTNPEVAPGKGGCLLRIL